MTVEPRDLALQALYEVDRRQLAQLPEELQLPSKARRIAQGVLDHINELDPELERVSDHWRVERMPVVDRAILRMGLYELRFEPETPVAVVVAEAVRLAKMYSTEKSGAFVNGVLAALAVPGGK